MSVRLVFERKSLFEYTVMLILIVGGAGCLARVLLTGDGNDKDKSGFKQIDEAVKYIYKKDKTAYINIIPNDKLIKYMLK